MAKIDFVQSPDLWKWGKYFSVKEFTCRGSGECLMEPSFMDQLFILRDIFRRPMVITSGFRSSKYNTEVSSTGTDGPHTRGRACDISIHGRDAFDLMSLALQQGFTGVGIRQHGPSRFIHLDDLRVSDGFPRPICWTYP